MRSLFRRVWRAFDGLAEDTLWAGMHDLYAALAAMVSFLLLQRVLQDTEYGAFFGLYGIIGPLGSLTFAGPGLALLQRWYRHNQPHDEILKSFLSLTLTVGVLSAVFAFVVGLIFINLTPLEIALVIASELLATSTIFVCAWLVQIAAGFPAMTRVKMGMVTLKLIAVGGLWLTDSLSIRNLAASYVVLYSGYVAWLVLVRLPAAGYHFRLGAPPADAFRSSAVFAVPMMASSIQLDGDKFVLNAFNQEADAGQYGAAFRIILLGALPLRVLGQAAFHRFLPAGEDVDGYSLRRVVRLTAFMFGVGVTLSVMFYLAGPLVDLLLDDEFDEANSIVRWLLLFLPLLALSEIPLNGLLSLGRAKERAAVYLSSSFFSVVMYLLLIPGRGWEGAVMATIIAELYLVAAAWIAVFYYQRRADSDRAERLSPSAPPTTDGISS